MEPMKTTKSLLTWLCMCSADKSTSVKQRILYILVASTIFALNLFCLVSNMVFFIKFVSTDSKGALFAFMSIFGNIAMLYTLMNAFHLRYKTNRIFGTLSVICCESKWLWKLKYFFEYTIQFNLSWIPTDNDIISAQILSTANDRSEWLWIVYIWYSISAFVSTAIMSVISVIFCWFIHKNLDAEHFYHPSKIMLSSISIFFRDV